MLNQKTHRTSLTEIREVVTQHSTAKDRRLWGAPIRVGSTGSKALGSQGKPQSSGVGGGWDLQTERGQERPPSLNALLLLPQIRNYFILELVL